MTRPQPRGLVALLLVCALARAVVSRGASAPAHPAAAVGLRLPATLQRAPGRALPLGPSERVLARAPGVHLQRRAYGSSLVALVQSPGARELHPPRVCLRAAGLEVVRRAEERGVHGCVTHLWVRRGRDAATLHFFHTYLRPAGGALRGQCGYWALAGANALARVVGQGAPLAALQLLDPDQRRARQRMALLLGHLRQPSRRRP